ncbi:mechanosensitive ion channel protein 6-like [Rhodamnia argentea]|uniref:Mechanosensitive ion channel protein n=1 Tax=Rhodamnia argentea TaxID=178133 RepID=A0A8B8MX56_9MYRT|nr:mechanosensitive ion channel protein 6-like [Rhodamnia argentea]
MNAGNGKIWRDPSYDFWKDGGVTSNKANSTDSKVGDGEEFDFQRSGEKGSEDPPSKLIGQFLHKQRASGDFSLDIDLEMQELKQDDHDDDDFTPLPPLEESPLKSRNKVSFHESGSSEAKTTKVSVENQQRQQEEGSADGQVLRCTSNASFHSNSSFKRKSRLLTTAATKNKSRLLGPPDQTDKKSDRGSKLSLSPKRGGDDDEDDPFAGEDLPGQYKKARLNLVILLEWVSLILIIGALVCSLTIPYLRKRTLWKLMLWKWEVMVLVLICGRLVSGWGIRIIVFFIERNFVLRKRVLYFVYGLRKAVQNCLWLGLVLVAWHFLFDKKVERETNSKALLFVTKVLVCLLVGTVIWLVKTLIVKVLASSFHVSTYFDRIQESLFNQYVIETLSGPPLVEMRKAEEEEEKIAVEVEKLQKAGAVIPPDLNAAVLPEKGSGRVIGSGRVQKSPRGKDKGEEGITIDHLHKLSPKNVSAWNMKRLMNLVRYGNLTTLDEQISGHDDESSNQINSESEARAAAKKIFQNVSRQGSKHIYLEDLMRFMPEDEAVKTMSLFEGASESQKISKSSLKNWVVNAFRERRALALTLDDTKTAVNKLHRMVNILVGILIAIVWLLILGIATKKVLLLISSQLLLVVFIFGNSCKTTFEALIFLFVIHPFDVGDRCEVDGVQMVVEEMNILTTIFLRYDNQKIIIPNSVLATKAISNYYRSPDMGDAVEFCVHISTPAEKIAMMKQRIISYIENKKDHWYPAPMFIFKDVEELNRLRIAVWLTHRMNHQDMGEKWARRAILVEEMVKIFRELDIQYRLLPLDINIRAMPPVTSTAPPTWTTPSG